MTTSSRNSLGPAFALGAAILLVAGFALAFYWVPTDADQGFSQRIFYLHVPVAFTAYACFGWGAWKALRLLWTRDHKYDLESYTAVHIGTIFGIAVLATGSVWGKISWGHWWHWGEKQLVVFLILFLFYCAYFMLRYSIDPGPRQERIAAVYALFGVILVPISFLAIRLLGTIFHPAVFTRDGVGMTASMFGTFLICLVGMILFAFALYQTELLGKRVDRRLRALRQAPAGEPRAITAEAVSRPPLPRVEGVR